MKDIGDKHIVLSGLWISIADPPELDGTILCFGASELDGLIRSQALCPDDPMTLNHPVVDPSFQPGDEPDLFAGKLVQPSKVQIRSIHNHNRQGRKPQQFGHCDVSYFGSGDFDKCGDVAVMVQKRMHVDAALGGAKGGPREKGKTEIYHGSIK